MVPELGGMSKPQWLQCSIPWVMDTFEVHSPVTPILCSLLNTNFGGCEGASPVPTALPVCTGCPKEGPQSHRILARKSSHPGSHKAISCLAFLFEVCPSSGFLQQLGSSYPGPAGGSEAARGTEQEGRRQGLRAGREEAKNTFFAKRGCIFHLHLGPGLLQLGQDSNPVHVPLSSEAVLPAGTKSGGVKHQFLGSLQVRSSLLYPTLAGPGMAASFEPLCLPGLK